MTDVVDRLRAALADRYTIERELGAGGMAMVYLAEDLKLHRKVALKVLRPELASALGPDRFLQEIDIAATLNHPHILGLFDCGEAAGFLYYVMPYVEGQSLREKLTKEGELPVAEAVRILRDVVDALSHAHRHNVVHRDIKPDNVMLSERHALVTDFGVAKAVSDATGAIGLTTEGVALGTPAYMAPEQASADPHIDHRADIYAVGVIAYELLTGRTPFVGNTQQELLAAHVTQTPEPVTKYREAVPPALAELVMKCLEKKAADRWQTAEELLPHLDALATPSGGSTPIGTVRVSAVARTKKIAIGAVAVAVVLAAILVVMLLPRGSGVVLDPERVLVAVFDNQTGDPALDPVGVMAGHWITQGLQESGLVQAVPWLEAQQASRYVTAAIDSGNIRNPVRALAEETGAAIVVFGAYYRRGDSVQYQVEVNNANRGQTLGSLDPETASHDTPENALDPLRERVMGLLAVSFDERLTGSASVQHAPPTFESYRAFDDGMVRYIRGEQRDALRFFERALELDSTFVSALRFAVTCHSNLGEYAQADSMLDVWATLDATLTDYERAWQEYFRARIDGDLQRALIAIRRAAEVAPESKAVYNRAVAALRVNDPQEAVDALRSLDPERGAMRGFASYWAYLTRSLHRLGDHEQELEAARRSHELYSDRGQGLRLQARALAAMGRVEELNEVLDELEISSNTPQMRTALSWSVQILQTKGHIEAVGDVLQRAINWLEARPSIETATAEHRLVYAKMLFCLGDLMEAQQVLDELVKEQADNVQFRGERGFVAATLGDSTLAMEDFEWLGGLDVRYLYGDNTYWRGVILGALGDPDRAVDLLWQAFAEGRSFMHDHDWGVALGPLRDHPGFQEFIRPKG